MTEPYKAIRELAHRALQSCDGDWNAAEQLMHRWLAEDLARKQQIMEGLLEFHIRHAITTEGRRHQQHQADLRREAIVAHEQAQETTQVVEEFLRDLEKPGGEEDEKKYGA
jgi:hypothetical protein